MSNTRKLWLLTIFSCVTLVSAGAFADYQTTADYSAGRKIVASKAYVDSQVDSAYTTLDNAKEDALVATGSATKPVYVDNNGDVAAVTYTLGQNVPVPTSEDAGKFLKADGSWAVDNDTQADWSESNTSSAAFIQNKPGNFGGATDSTAGSTGMVPQPAAKADKKYLSGDGNWRFVKVPVSSAEPTDNNTTDLASIWVQ